MKTIIFTLLFMVSSSLLIASTTYRLDEQVLDNLFYESADVTYSEDASVAAFFSPSNITDNNTQMIAGIVALGSWFTGIGILIPIHRFIAGVNGKGVKVFFLYFCTNWACAGAVTLVDGIVMLADSSGRKYSNNGKWIMWLGKK